MKKILLGGLPTVVTVFKTTEKRYSIQPRLTIPDADPIGVVSELRITNSGNIDN